METSEVVAVHPRAAHRPVTPLRVRVIAALLVALAPAQARANAMHTPPDGVAGGQRAPCPRHLAFYHGSPRAEDEPRNGWNKRCAI